MASNVSELMPDKVSFGYGFPCDGPGRGGTCDISAFDGLYLAIFWMLNMLWPASWVCVWSGDELCGSVAGVFGGSVSMRLGYCQTIPMAPMMYPRWTSTVCTRRTRPRFWHPTCSPRVLCVRTALLVLRMMYPPTSGRYRCDGSGVWLRLWIGQWNRDDGNISPPESTVICWPSMAE